MKENLSHSPASAPSHRTKPLSRNFWLQVLIISAVFCLWVRQATERHVSSELTNHQVYEVVFGANSRFVLQKKEKFQKCSIDEYRATGFEFLKTAERPPWEEYVLRRNNLAQALVIDGVDAFVVEPGFTFSYYANITQESSSLRPMLTLTNPFTAPMGRLGGTSSLK